jgi:hypothetical protein
MTTQQNSVVSNDFSAKLESLNLDSVANILVASNGLTRQQAEQEIADYKLYLTLTHQHPGQKLVPSKPIDYALHAHMLSAQFDEDCERLFGCVLDHDEPDFGNGDDAEQRAWQMAFQRTKQLFKQFFGLDLMGDPAPCFTIACDGCVTTAY